MPPGKRRQSNAMLYTLVTFVALFVIATTVAVIYYVRAEDLRTKNKDGEQKLKELASSDEQRRMGEIVGDKISGQSYMGSLNEYMDQLVITVIGKPVPSTTAQMKVTKDIPRVLGPLVAQAQAYIGTSAAVVAPAAKPADANAADPNSKPAVANASDPNNKPAVAKTDDPDSKSAAVADVNQPALTTVLAGLLNVLKQTTDARDLATQQLQQLQAKFDSETEAWAKARASLKADVEDYRKQVEATKNDYAALREQLNQRTSEQTANFDVKLKDAQAKAQQLDDDLSKTKSDLKLAEERVKASAEQMGKIQPAPATLVAAQKPDGKVIMVNPGAGTVLIDLGSEDHVYPGLTFSVYDRFAGIGKDGKPKAEVEVFAIDNKVCTARVLSSEEKNPIVTSDMVANLIWDRSRQNRFVIAGDFDLTGDGKPEPDAIDRIKSLIEKWGGAVEEAVSARTDFVVLADPPEVPKPPTEAALQADPTLRDKYDAAQERLDRYNQIKQQANALYIPVLNYERFLYFTGYKTESTRPGAF